MQKIVINPTSMVRPIGPYSLAVRIPGGLVFLSGQIPVDPLTGELVEADIAVQTRQCLQNITILLTDMGLQMADIVKTTVYLTSMEHFKTMNDVYASFFPTEPPARSTVAVAALPRGALIEIEAIAVDRR